MYPEMPHLKKKKSPKFSEMGSSCTFVAIRIFIVCVVVHQRDISKPGQELVVPNYNTGRDALTSAETIPWLYRYLERPLTTSICSSTVRPTMAVSMTLPTLDL